jgi:hypothetical protein
MAFGKMLAGEWHNPEPSGILHFRVDSDTATPNYWLFL